MVDEKSESDMNAEKLQQAYMIGKYKPEAQRADRLASNIPGGHTSSFGANADHTIGHGGSN